MDNVGGMFCGDALVVLLVRAVLVAVAPVADRLDDDPVSLVPVGGELNANRFHLAADRLRLDAPQVVAVVAVIDQLVAREQRAETQLRPGETGVRIGLLARVEMPEALLKRRRGGRFVAAQRESAVRLLTTEFVTTDAFGDENVADRLFLRIDAESNADGDDRLRFPGGDRVIGRVLRLAFALRADAQHDTHAAVFAEQVIAHAVARFGRRLRGAMESANDGGGFVVVAGDQDDQRQIAGRNAALIGDQLRRRDGVQLAGGGERRPRRRPGEPDPALFGAAFLVGGDFKAQVDSLCGGGVVERALQPVERRVGARRRAQGEQFGMDACDLGTMPGIGDRQQLLGVLSEARGKLKPSERGTCVVGRKDGHGGLEEGSCADFRPAAARRQGNIV